MKAYKVFKKLKNGALVSVGKMPKNFRVCYHRTKTNFAKDNGELFCYVSFRDAQILKDQESRLNPLAKFEVWSVQVPRLTERILLPTLWNVSENASPATMKMIHQEIRRFWKEKEEYSYDNYRMGLGTAARYAASSPSIKLIKKLC